MSEWQEETLLRHSAVVYGLAFTPDSRHLLSGSEDGTLRQWDVADGQCVRVMQGYEVSLYDLAWSPDGTWLASAGSETVVSIWEVASARRYKALDGHRLTVYGLAWSPDSSLLASSGWDSAIRLWDPTTGTCIQILPGLFKSRRFPSRVPFGDRNFFVVVRADCVRTHHNKNPKIYLGRAAGPDSPSLRTFEWP